MKKIAEAVTTARAIRTRSAGTIPGGHPADFYIVDDIDAPSWLNPC